MDLSRRRVDVTIPILRQAIASRPISSCSDQIVFVEETKEQKQIWSFYWGKRDYGSIDNGFQMISQCSAQFMLIGIEEELNDIITTLEHFWGSRWFQTPGSIPIGFWFFVKDNVRYLSFRVPTDETHLLKNAAIDHRGEHAAILQTFVTEETVHFTEIIRGIRFVDRWMNTGIEDLQSTSKQEEGVVIRSQQCSYRKVNGWMIIRAFLEQINFVERYATDEESAAYRS